MNLKNLLKILSVSFQDEWVSYFSNFIITLSHFFDSFCDIDQNSNDEDQALFFFIKVFTHRSDDAIELIMDNLDIT
jgi:hypothetical protein